MRVRLLPILILSVVAMAGCGKADIIAGSAGVDAGEVKDTAAGMENEAGAEQESESTEEKSEAAELPLNVIDDKYRTTYEVFVYSFYDSDRDGIGDLKGLTEKLDYINDGDDATDTDLGCNEIWLMPISPSPTYHKYDVTDYMDIDEQYGTLDDFDELVKKCHDRKVNVIIDLVLNHTSVLHPWFTEAAEFISEHPEAVTDPDKFLDDEDADYCPYVEYYNFSAEKKDGYEPLEGTDFFYEARFWSGMPDLNLDCPDVRQEISDITQFWIDHGVDGFRLDAVTSYYTGDDGRNIEFLTLLNDMVKAQKSDAYIVGEAWTNSATYLKYYESGIDSFFDFDYAGSEGIIAATVKGSSPAARFGRALVGTESAISSSDGIDAPFYTNHDMARSCGYYVGKRAVDRLKMAGALNLLMKGNAFIYYGEELGMKGSGKDENKRAPMYWSGDKDEEGTCSGPKDMDSFDMKYPPLSEQEDDPYSIYNYYKSAIRMRNTFPSIARGSTAMIEELSGDSICAFVRSHEEYGDVLVVFNTSEDEMGVKLSGSSTASGFTELAFDLETGQERAKLENGDLILPSYGIAILR